MDGQQTAAATDQPAKLTAADEIAKAFDGNNIPHLRGVLVSMANRIDALEDALTK